MASQRFELDRLAEYTDEALLAELKRVAALVPGKTLPRKTFEEHSKVAVSTLRRHFGSWEAALAAAGLADRYDAKTLSIKTKEQRGKGLTSEEVLSELRRVAALLGGASMTVRDFNQHSVFEGGVVRRRFGTWKHALERAGLDGSPMGRRYSDEECFENLLSVWTHYGRPPTHREMNAEPSQVGAKAYIKRWGTWNKTLHAFVERANCDAPANDPADASPVPTVAPPRLNHEADQRDIRLGLRYAVLRRDRFRCVICGASPAVTIGCTLHVDHVFPFSKGGKTVIENLRTLCENCNLGKGVKLENDA